MAVQGTGTIDFGATPTQRAVVTVSSGVGAIQPTSSVEAWIMSEASADHSDYEHEMAAMAMALVCGNIVTSTSFDVVATSLVALRGAWTFRWVWN